MNLLQLTVDATVSANWLIGISVSLCVLLLTKILNRMQKKQDEHDAELKTHGNDIVALKALQDPEEIARSVSTAIIRAIREIPEVKYPKNKS